MFIVVISFSFRQYRITTRQILCQFVWPGGRSLHYCQAPVKIFKIETGQNKLFASYVNSLYRGKDYTPQIIVILYMFISPYLHFENPLLTTIGLNHLGSPLAVVLNERYLENTILFEYHLNKSSPSD